MLAILVGTVLVMATAYFTRHAPPPRSLLRPTLPGLAALLAGLLLNRLTLSAYCGWVGLPLRYMYVSDQIMYFNGKRFGTEFSVVALAVDAIVLFLLLCYVQVRVRRQRTSRSA